ncbi:MAG: T9SS type A sorting domain-containing protein [Sediminibacterium sp.]|nr:T9SS type A sorting domain-containing protein [Sediminibacterium sp.]
MQAFNIISVFFWIVLFHLRLAAQEKVTIYGNQLLDPSTKFMQGFLHGNPKHVDSVLTAKLKPQFWRIGAYALAGSGYLDAKRFNPKITININDYYMIANGITTQTLSHPWVNNWVDWDNTVTTLANNAAVNNLPVEYWDVWGEPDNFWTGTYAQWIEMYRRTRNIIAGILPGAKVIGPEFGFATCNFQVNPILKFLDSLHTAGGSVTGVSWHEFCNPEDITVHVKQVQDSLVIRPWLGNLQILIPEYAGPANHIIPGWNVGWLYYFETAKVDWVSHGCWNESDGVSSWSDCEFGLNGLFMKNNLTPQPNYWVHRAYAELNGVRVKTVPNQPRTVALAVKNNTVQEMKIIVGRYDNPNLGSHNASANVEIKLKDYPYGSNLTLPLFIQRIPSNNVPFSVPLLAPVTTFTGNITFSGDSASVFISNFVDGDVYLVYVNPSVNSILTSLKQSESDAGFTANLSPNPAAESILFTCNQTEFKDVLQIIDSYGNVLTERDVTDTTKLSVSGLASGVYFFRLKNHVGWSRKILKD